MATQSQSSEESQSPTKGQSQSQSQDNLAEDPRGEEDILTSVCPEGVQNDTVKTFIFKKQGHTLGNLLRDHLLKYEEVDFCGYSIPHPGENVMHLRIQTRAGVSANDMLKRALKDVIDMCEHVEETFEKEVLKAERKAKKQ